MTHVAHPAGELDADGLFKGREGLMRTWTDKRVDPLDLQLDDIDILDIAHALARQCRYNGHCESFISVARHCLWVSKFLEDSTQDRALALWGLLHDASETYIGDMIRPLKHRPEMQLFRDADAAADEVIARKFGLVWPQPDEVKKADNWVLNTVELNNARWSPQCDSVFQDETQFLARFRSLTS